MCVRTIFAPPAVRNVNQTKYISVDREIALKKKPQKKINQLIQIRIIKLIPANIKIHKNQHLAL